MDLTIDTAAHFPVDGVCEGGRVNESQRCDGTRRSNMTHAEAQTRIEAMRATLGALRIPGVTAEEAESHSGKSYLATLWTARNAAGACVVVSAQWWACEGSFASVVHAEGDEGGFTEATINARNAKSRILAALAAC